MYRLLNRLPYFYGWNVLFAAGSSMVVRNAAASLTLAVFIFPMSEDLGWSRTLIAGAASVGGLAATIASPLVGWALDKYGARVILMSSLVHSYQICICVTIKDTMSSREHLSTLQYHLDHMFIAHHLCSNLRVTV